MEVRLTLYENYSELTVDVMEGLTETQIGELQKLDGVKSVEKESYINVSGMPKEKGEMKVSATVFEDSEYESTYRKYTQKQLGLPFDKEGDYFSIGEIRGISPQDEQKISYYEKVVDMGEFHRDFIRMKPVKMLLFPVIR